MKQLRKLFLTTSALILIAITLTSGFSLKIPGLTASSQNEVLLENIPRISRAVHLIQNQYYDPARIQPRKMIEEGFNALAQEVPEILPTLTGQTLVFQLGAQKTTIALPAFNQLSDALAPISQAFEFISKNYTGKTSLEDMQYTFIGGMLTVLDPHSNVFSPDDYKEFKTRTEGSYGGLGIAIGPKDGVIEVRGVFENSPAQKMGILTGDLIVQISNQSALNMALDEAVDLMRGTPNTPVTLKVRTGSAEPREITLTRQVIAIENVISRLFTVNNKAFVAIKIKSFQEDTTADVVTALDTLTKKAGHPLAGIVLDLRDNPGGLLDQSIRLSDLFLETGDVVFTVGANNTTVSTDLANKDATDVSTPLVVLIDQGSASAAEIVAGALKNNDRAIVVGQRSFGKGSVQALLSLRDGAMMKLTIAQYLTPGRESIQTVGIHPDIHIFPAIFSKDRFDLIENLDFSEGKLTAHLENASLVKASANEFFSFSYSQEIPEKKEGDIDTSYFTKIEDNDYPIQLAIKLLDAQKGNAKTDILQSMKPVLQTEAKAQDQVIANLLKQKNIDWQIASEAKQPKLTLRSVFLNEQGVPVNSFMAGTKVTFQILAKNTGAEPITRLLVDTDAENPLTNHLEFVFGKLAPGEERPAQVTIEVPTEMVPFTEHIKLTPYFDKTPNESLAQQATTQFVEKERPELAYSYEILDGNFAPSVGNQNGIPEKGEHIILRVTARNVGSVDSTQTVINLKNKEGEFVLLKQAREEVGLLKPNQEIAKDLTFDVNSNFIKTTFEAELFVTDTETQSGLSDTLKFDVSSPAPSTPTPKQLQIAPHITLAQNIKPVRGKLMLTGSVSDDERIKDIAIFSKGKKCAYINLENLGVVKTKSFSQEIVLEKGLNPIVVQVRDNRDLEAQKTVMVVEE